MRYQPMLDEDGERIAVIRPENPQMALMLAKIAVEKNDRALFERMPTEVGDYRYRGFAAKDKKSRAIVIVDENGKFLKDVRAGDSFVTLKPKPE